MRSPWAIAVALLGASALLLLGCGGDNDAAGGQTINITMTDNAFEPTQFSVPEGEAITLRFTNDGSVRHEAVLGDEMDQQNHHEEMSDSTMSNDMEMGHDNSGHSSSDDLDAVTVEPGKTGSMTTTFAESGTVLIGCHEPGHWEAGMKATINVR